MPHNEEESEWVGSQGMSSIAACGILLLGWRFELKMKGTTLLEVWNQVHLLCLLVRVFPEIEDNEPVTS